MSEKLCEKCGLRPIGGYIGNGTILTKLCRKCHRENGEVATGHRGTKGVHGREGKS